MSTATIAAPPLSGSMPAPAAGGPILSFDAEVFRRNFSQRPFLVQHLLVGHPKLELDQLLELSKRLPESSVEYNAGTLPIGQDPKSTPRTGLSVQDTIQRIASCKSWMVLKNVEQDPAYEALLDECLAVVRPHSEPVRPGMMEKEGFIFITSPGSVTPFHIDIEHNFLLQVRGTKTIYIFDKNDRSVISEKELEDFYAGAHRNLKYNETYAGKAQVFDLAPGDGLHFPITWPHWVKNGGEVSVSFSVTFRTPDCHQIGHVYRMNSLLRRMKLKPKPPGSGVLRDKLKSVTIRAISRIGRALGRKSEDSHGY